MEVILKQDIQNLGQKDEIVKVRDGYARNYLIPQGLATTATSSAKKVLAENTKQRAHKEAKVKDEAQQFAEKMKGIKLQIGAKTSTTGKIFGSVNTIQVAEALKERGYDVDRKNISLINADTIKEVGSYKAKVKLHREVILEVDFEIISE
jgi:large subunit ribosomal protein L9